MFAGILAKQIDPYEGAFEAYRLLRSGRRWDRSGWSHDDRGHVVNDRPELWTRDLRRPILAHMTEWWERRDELRDRVEAEIVRFANAWTSGAEDAIANDRSAWSAWMDEEGQPFPDVPETNDLPEPRLHLEDDVDLRRVSDTSLMRLDLEYAQLASLDGLERFRWLRSLTLYNVRGLAGVRAIEQLEGLRDLRICTDEPGLAHAVCELDLSRFPQLQRLSLGCHIGETLRLDTAWIPGVATSLRELDIGAFAPLSGAYDDFAAATRLVQLDVSELEASDATELRTSLPLTTVELHDPIEIRNAGGVYPFDLIWEFPDRRGGFSMSPSLADAWGVDNESDAQDHLISLVDEHDAGLLRRVEFDSELEFMQINATSRYDLEEVLKVATRATSARFQHHVWRTVEGLPYTVLPVDGREITSVCLRLGSSGADRRVLTVAVVWNEGQIAGVIGDPMDDPDGAELCRAWLDELGLWYADDAPDAAAKTADLAIRDAFHRLAVRVARGIRRSTRESPPVLVDGVDPWSEDLDADQRR